MINFISIGEKIGQILKDSFNINLTDFLINIAATIILVIIIRFCFWNKITAFLEKKREKVANEFKGAEEKNIEADRIKAEAEKTLSDSRTEASEIISGARAQAQVESEKIIESAKDKANTIVDEGKKEALREKEIASKELKKEVVNLASEIASKMIDEKIDPDKYNKKVLKDIGDKDE